jgi:hypothetical protein
VKRNDILNKLLREKRTDLKKIMAITREIGKRKSETENEPVQNEPQANPKSIKKLRD